MSVKKMRIMIPSAEKQREIAEWYAERAARGICKLEARAESLSKEGWPMTKIFVVG
jgi:hypothetical protein